MTFVANSRDFFCRPFLPSLFGFAELRKKVRMYLVLLGCLVTRPKYPPPHPETGVAIPLWHSVCFLWYRRLSLLHPHFFPWSQASASYRQWDTSMMHLFLLPSFWRRGAKFWRKFRVFSGSSQCICRLCQGMFRIFFPPPSPLQVSLWTLPKDPKGQRLKQFNLARNFQSRLKNVQSRLTCAILTF